MPQTDVAVSRHLPTDRPKMIWKELSAHIHLSWPGWTTIGIWVSVTTIMVALTVRDLLPLLFEYMNNNIDTRIAIVTNDEFPMPNATVCFTYYSFSLLTIVQHITGNSARENKSTCIECDGLRNHSWDLWQDIVFDSAASDDVKAGRLAEELLKRLLSEERDKDFPSAILRKSNFNWNQPLMGSVSYLFCYYGMLDHLYLSDDRDIYNLCETSFNTTNVGIVEDSDLDHLYRLYIDGIYVYLRDWVNGDFDLIPAPNLLTRNPSLFGNYFCVPTNTSYYGEKFTWQAFPNDTDAPPWKRSLIHDSMIAKDDIVMYTHITDTDVLYMTDRTRLVKPSHEIVMVKWEVRTKITDQRPQKSCSPDSNAARCLVSYQLHAAMEHCRCTPFTYRHMVAVKTLPYCNYTHYVGCESQLRGLLPKHRAICDNVCEYTVFDWQYSLLEYKQEPLDVTLGFFFTPSTKRYIEFRISLKTTPEMFVSQIGGVVNFYLGVDGLTICTVLIFFTNILKRWYRKKAQAKRKNAIMNLGAAPQSDPAFRYPYPVAEPDEGNGIDTRAALARMDRAMQTVNKRLQNLEERVGPNFARR